MFKKDVIIGKIKHTKIQSQISKKKTFNGLVGIRKLWFKCRCLFSSS